MKSNPELIIRAPDLRRIDLSSLRPQGTLLGRSFEEWRSVTRTELGLATERPIIGTGHQAVLWHPGILAKYLVLNEIAEALDFAAMNVVVDQHTGGFNQFEAPHVKPDGSLGVRRVELCKPPPPDVPMGRLRAFTPLEPPTGNGAFAFVNDGIHRIFSAVQAHQSAPNAALQMTRALFVLMVRWVKPVPNITATDLMGTSIVTALLREMIADPQRCAECYNRAVAQIHEAGVAPLLVRDDYVELPLWRIGEGNRRMRGYDSDVERALDDHAARGGGTSARIDLLPRALLMTAIIRLAVCDLFIHGTGGAVYDRAMEMWIREWLGVEVSPIAVVSANLRLPLLRPGEPRIDLNQARLHARRLWHDPQNRDGSPEPSQWKRQWLARIAKLPRNSHERRIAFLHMHEELERQREAHRDEVRAATDQLERATRQAADLAVANRRDWAFPLYPIEMIDDLAQRARSAVGNESAFTEAQELNHSNRRST